jgi:RNA polymerase sigma factor (sigma-70 family)
LRSHRLPLLARPTVVARSAAAENERVAIEARAQVQALVARLADGDRGALEAAYELLWPLVRRFCARALADSADAEDAAQHALLKTFEQVADYDSRRDALAWVLTIASFECRTLRKKLLRRREQALETGSTPGVDDGPEALVIERDAQRAVHEALASLRPEDQRTILVAMGLVDDVGGNQGVVAPATFRKRLERAKERLRVIWRTKHGTE